MESIDGEVRGGGTASDGRILVRQKSITADPAVVIEVVENEAHVEKLLPILDEIVTEGALVTVERVRVIKYAGVSKRGSAGSEA